MYDSPLHTLWGKIALAVGFVVVVYLGWGVWVDWLTPPENGLVLLFGMLLALLGSLLLIALLRFLDRREPEPWLFYLGVLVISVFLTVAPAAYFNGISPLDLLTVGFNEEFWKVFPLILLVIFFPTMVSGVRDGMIYGALGGIAFNILEIGTYVMRVSFPAAGIAGAGQQMARLGWWGVGDHVLWSALVGAGIGWGIQSTNRRTKILAPLGAYLLAAVVHDLNDTVGAVVVALVGGLLVQLQGVDMKALAQDPAKLETAIQNVGSLAIPLTEVLMNVVTIPILFIALWKSGDWERSVVRDELKDEVGTVVTPEEYQGVLDEKRLHVRSLPGYRSGVGRAIRNAQNSLAFFKFYLRRKNRPVQGNPLAAYWREEVARLRVKE